MQIGRSSAGSALAADTSDHVSVNGSISLDGILQLSLETGYTPQANDILYLIIHSAGTSTTGAFADVNGVALNGGSTFNFDNFTWQITENANAAGNSFTGGNDVAIEAIAAVPEPSTCASILGAFGMLIFLQKKSRRKIRIPVC
jgi:hypothetical protein